VRRDDFADFFAVVRPGQRPFAWQERLLDALLADGRWPDRIVAPTGAGKTAVIDVHVFANALSAAGASTRLPRRLVLVVDRRAVVDSHDEHARRVGALLAQAHGGVLAETAGLLRSLRLEVTDAGVTNDGLSLDDDPLLTARLRGGAPPPRDWRDAPEVCAVLTGTPDMIGSRLLLQGYGSSPRAWPREAGLLAFDTALVVDEAHLSRQFLATARRVATLAASPQAVTGAVPVLQVVETTATPQPGEGSEVGVEQDDLADPVLDRRMRAPKPVDLLILPSWPLAPTGKGVAHLAQEVARARAEFGPTVGAVVNRVATAVELAKQLRAKDLRVEILVGRMRPADVAHLRRRRPGLLDTQGNAGVDVLVATQTVEVGLDLDLSALVTELAPAAALAQRSGRVNRRGDRATTRVVVAVPESILVPDTGAGPYSGDDLTAARQWIAGRASLAAGLAPWAVRQDPPPGQALRRAVLRRVELADSWAWARTGDAPFGRADLDLWLADDLDAERDLWLVSRADLPEDPVQALTLLRLLPPRAHEVFRVDPKTMEGLLEHWFNEPKDNKPARTSPVLRWRDGETEELTSAEGSRTGDIVIVDASFPVQQQGVVVADRDRSVAADVLEHVGRGLDGQVRPGDVVLRWGTLREQDDASLLGRLPSAARELLTVGPTGALGGWSRDQRRALGDLLATVVPRPTMSREMADDLLVMRDAAVDLLRDGRVKDSTLHLLPDASGEPGLLVMLDLRRAAADEDARQTWTPSEKRVPLARHADAVAAVAGLLGTSLGLHSDEVEVLRLAGQHHDDGKADPRFQGVLGRTVDGPLLAKSAYRSASSDTADRSAAGLPSGWRHEQLSALEAWRAVAEPARGLVTRLAGTTHGHGRCGFPHGAASLLGVTRDALPDDARALFDEGEWEQLVQDTDERHGVWALAFLEAVLRAADGRVSAAGS